jgi:tetratricopeptide (TPR) repeat protein
VRAARVYARRGTASAEFNAWLDAVEAECETRCGHTREALQLIGQAEDALAAGGEHSSPDWFDWFSPVRLAAFKGNTELEAGYVKQARATLTTVLEQLSEEGGKQRAVILSDLAAVEAAEGNPEAACIHAEQALDLLAIAWYATAMDRIRNVRRALQAWADHESVKRLDDRLYDWETTFSALQR